VQTCALPISECRAASADARLRGEPRLEPPQRFLDVRGGRGEAEADEAATVDRVEVHAWGQGDAGLFEHAGAEGQAVVGEMADVGPDVERAIRRRDALQSQRRQRVE